MKLKKIVVTGSRGFLGRHAVPVLEQHYGPQAVVALSRGDYDLEQPSEVRPLFEQQPPPAEVHLAAYVGG